MQIIKGTTGLLSSRKGSLSLIIIACITYLCATGRMDGMSFAAVMGSIQLIFCFTHSKTDQQYMNVVPNQFYNGGIFGDTSKGPIQKIKDKIDELPNKPII